MKKQSHATRRNSKGSGIVEGAVGLMMIITGVVFGTLLLVNSGLSGVYKEKLSFVTDRAASYAAHRTSWNGSYVPGMTPAKLEQELTPVVDEMLTKMGLPKSTFVHVEQSGQTMTVSVKVVGLVLMGQGTILPSRIDMLDTATTVLDNQLPPGLLTISLQNDTNTMVTIPCYGKFINGYSNGQISNLDTAPKGTALFMNRPVGSYSQFSMSAAPGAYSETLATH